MFCDLSLILLNAMPCEQRVSTILFQTKEKERAVSEEKASLVNSSKEKIRDSMIETWEKEFREKASGMEKCHIYQFWHSCFVTFIN